MPARLIAAVALISAYVFASSPAWAQNNLSFDGIYAGAEFGWETIDISVKDFPTEIADDNGFYYGVIAGFRRQMNTGLVIGVEGNFGRASPDATLAVTLDEDRQATIRFDTDWEFGADALIGYALTSNFMVFGLVGYRWLTLDFKAVGETGADFADPVSGTTGDIHLGGGVEFAFTDQINLRASGSYVDYDEAGVGFETWRVTGAAVYKF